MKQFIHYIFFCLPLLTGLQVSAQCEPDTSCTDFNDTGVFCPKILPDVILNVPYEAVLTVLPPSKYDYEGNIFEIAYIEIDSVVNFPSGITYTVNADRYYADSAYCVLISGTAAQTGIFTLKLYVTPYIRLPLVGIIKGPQTIDNTSVVLTVQDVTNTEFPSTKEFEVLQNAPNPFSQSTRIGFYTPISDNINLKIYNILGERIHEASSLVVPGEHFFRFDGSDLQAGSYLYMVTSSSSHHTRKLIKSR